MTTKAIIDERGIVRCRTVKGADECTRWLFDCRCDDCPMAEIVKKIKEL